jgi:hypothetical protein
MKLDRTGAQLLAGHRVIIARGTSESGGRGVGLPRGLPGQWARACLGEGNRHPPHLASPYLSAGELPRFEMNVFVGRRVLTETRAASFSSFGRELS